MLEHPRSFQFSSSPEWVFLCERPYPDFANLVRGRPLLRTTKARACTALLCDSQFGVLRRPWIAAGTHIEDREEGVNHVDRKQRIIRRMHTADEIAIELT